MLKKLEQVNCFLMLIPIGLINPVSDEENNFILFYFIYCFGNEPWSFQIDPKRAVPRGPGQQAVIAQQNSGAPVVVSTV